MIDSRFSVFIFVASMDDLMSFTQDVYFYLDMDTRRELVWMHFSS